MRALAEAIDSGLPLPAFARSGALAGLPPATAARLIADADAGVAPSATLDALGVLDPATLGLLRAKEAHGSLPQGLRTLADRLEQRRRGRARLLQILLYPSAMLLAAAVIGPIPVAFSQGVGAYLARALPAGAGALALPVLIGGVLPRLAPSGWLREVAARLGAALPLIGSALLHGALASFADVLGAALGAGLPARDAIPLAAQAASSHPAFAAAGPTMVARLDAGATLVEALSAVRCFPAPYLGRIGFGETSGTLVSVLETLRRDHEESTRLAWLLVIGVLGAAATLGAIAFIAHEIISGFTHALNTVKEGIDAVAPPP